MAKKTTGKSAGRGRGKKAPAGRKKSQKRVSLQDWFRKSWLAVLGAAKTISDESDRMFNKLVEKGEVSEAELKNRVAGLRETIQGLREDVERRVREIEEKVKELSSTAPFNAEDFQKYVEKVRERVSKLWKR